MTDVSFTRMLVPPAKTSALLFTTVDAAGFRGGCHVEDARLRLDKNQLFEDEIQRIGEGGIPAAPQLAICSSKKTCTKCRHIISEPPESPFYLR